MFDPDPPSSEDPTPTRVGSAEAASEEPGADGPATAQQRRSTAVLAGYGGDLDYAVSSLADADPAVRETAIGAVERLGGWTAATLAGVLSDPTPKVRCRAALAAARTGMARAELLALLDDEDSTVVEVAAFALGERPDGDADSVKALAAVAVDHGDHLCRESAVAALGSLVARTPDLEQRAVTRALAAVLAGTRDRATVRRRAVLALAAFDSEEATAALRRLREDRDLQVRQAADDLLAIEEGEEVGGP